MATIADMEIAEPLPGAGPRFPARSLDRSAQARDQPTSGWPAYLLALGIGLVLDAMLFPPSVTLGLHAWDQPLTGDVALHVAGQRAFIIDAWRWPLLTTKLLRWPEGINIAFTDSIPIVAFAAKLIRFALPAGFHGVFLWVAISWAVQPAAAVFALRSAGERRLIPAAAAAVIGASMPTLLYRIGHAALCAHFLILLALGCYFRLRLGADREQWIGPGALLIVALLVHPYLLFMVAAVLAAAPLSSLVNAERGWRRSGLAFFAAPAITAAIAALLGYFRGAAPPQEGFGVYSMNLLSPVYPSHSRLFGRVPELDATRGQYEGYQYLGAGVLLLAVAACPWLCLRLRSLKRHAGLLIATTALTFLALSSTIYAGPLVLLQTRHVPVWLNQLRASGRLFWPMAYLLMVGSIIIVARSLPRSVAMPLLGIAAILQFVDAQPLRSQARETLRPAGEWLIATERLRPLVAGHDRLTIWPPFGCGAEDDEAARQLVLLASEYGVRTNTMFSARHRRFLRTGTASRPASRKRRAPSISGQRSARGARNERWSARLPPTWRVGRMLGRSETIADLPALDPAVIPSGGKVDPESERGREALGLGWAEPAGGL